MVHSEYDSEHPNKRQRREIQRKPIPARLVFDDNVRGDDALVSEALWTGLFGGSHALIDSNQNDQTPGEEESFLAISPWSPLYVDLTDFPWTTLSARLDKKDGLDISADQQHFIKLSSRSSACQSFMKAAAAADPNRQSGHIPKSIEIRAIRATPIMLETVYISVEKGLLQKVDEIQSRFGGGFHFSTKNRKSDKQPSIPNDLEHALSSRVGDRMVSLVREGLSRLPIIHSGDVFRLPLPSHPITHVPAPPAIIIECEPVSQGLISGKTKVVLVNAGSSQEKALKKMVPAQPIIEESIEDTAEDTSNDQFFSAAEDRSITTASDSEGSSDGESATEESARGDSDEDSDSMDDMISLSAPGLPPQQAGTLSAMTAATPRPLGHRASGIHTPGSVYSNFTTTTARAGSRPGKVFRTEALLRKITADLLHPKPSTEEDEESFVFVDTSTLARIGCFSGDWVRIEGAQNFSLGGFESSGFAALNGYMERSESNWRPVKVYGLSNIPSQKARYAVDKTGNRSSSFSQRDAAASLTPTLYLSPVLLANLSSPAFVKIGMLPKPPRPEGRSVPLQRPPAFKDPPIAREIKLVKLTTPTTMTKETQSVLFSALKHHFEVKKRILKEGDLIAVPVDVTLGKTVSSTEAVEDISADEDIIMRLNAADSASGHQAALGWFAVQYIDAEQQLDHELSPEQNHWGGVATVGSTITRISQAGNSVRSIPDITELWTKYWLGTRKVIPHSTFMPEIVTSTANLPQLEQLPLQKRLSSLIAASISPRAVNLGLPPLVVLLYSTQRQVGKSFTARSACSASGVNSLTISAHELLAENASSTGGGDMKTEALLRVRADRALACGPNQTTLLIQHIDVLTADRLIPTLQDIISSSRVLIATTSKIDDVSPGIRSLFTHELEVSAPNEAARESILRNICLSASVPLSPSISLRNLALQTAALVAGDLADVIHRASLARSARLLSLAESQSCTVSDILLSGGQFTTHLLQSDFTTAISAARSTFSDAIGAPKIPSVTWNDIGGLSSQKDAIMETISLPLSRPDLFANGVRKRSGILFYGPPGTGKTLLAKAIATEFSLNFFSIKGPELLNMYIGESEANVRRVFQKARDARPCVVFFDELDSVAPKRGNQGDSGGVMDRIVSQLLAELDGMSSSSSSSDNTDGTSQSSNATGGVFVIGATNRPDLLDPALLRPGRFDKMLYLGVADTHDQQVTILKALTRKFTLTPDINLPRIAQRLPLTYTGADLYALCSDAMLKAITRKTKLVDQKVQRLSDSRGETVSTSYFFDHLATEEDVQVVVNEEDFHKAQDELVGSVSRKELDHFERIRNLFEDQDISAPAPSSNKTQQSTATANHQSPTDNTHTKEASMPDITSLSLNKAKGKAKQKPHQADARAPPPQPPRPQAAVPSTKPKPLQRTNTSFRRTESTEEEGAGESDYGFNVANANANGHHMVNGKMANGGITKGKGKGRDMDSDGYDYDEDGDGESPAEEEGLYD